jgi:hypothetical protein
MGSTIKVVVAASDSAVLRGLNEGWVELPVSLMESHVRTQLSPSIPRNFRSEAASARWLSVATRLATVRRHFSGREYRSRLYVVRWPGLGGAARGRQRRDPAARQAPAHLAAKPARPRTRRGTRLGAAPNLTALSRG